MVTMSIADLIVTITILSCSGLYLFSLKERDRREKREENTESLTLIMTLVCVVLIVTVFTVTMMQATHH